MQTDVKKVFYFHADANSLGGFVDEPFRFIPSQASVSLPSVGGYASVRAHDFKFEEVISCRSTYTHVAGRPIKTNGPWTARVTAVVEGLDVLGVLTAERAVARLFVEHPEDGGPPKVSFAGSHFHNLRLLGKEVAFTLNPTLLPAHHRAGDVYNEDDSFTPEIEWSALWEVAQKQSSALRDTSGVPGWAVERYGWLSSKRNAEDGGPAICSLVDRVEATTPAQAYGHFLEVPDIGRFFLGEAMILPQSIQLTLIRAELGCKTKGQTSIATARTNGSSYPP
jgi:hypothetical protein